MSLRRLTVYPSALRRAAPGTTLFERAPCPLAAPGQRRVFCGYLSVAADHVQRKSTLPIASAVSQSISPMRLRAP